MRHTTYTIRFPMPDDPTPPLTSVPAPARTRPGEFLTPLAIGALALVVLYVGRAPRPAPAPAPDQQVIPVRPIPHPPPNPNPRPRPRPDPAPQPQPAPQPVPEAEPEPAPQPEPAITSPLALAARDYVRGLSGTFGDMADGIEGGRIKDKTAAVELAKQRRQKFTAALDKLFDGATDDAGKITDPAPIVRDLREMARATRFPGGGGF